MTQSGYDHEWLRQGFLKRQANYSSIICFETGDSFRLSQLKAYIVHCNLYNEADIYYLNNWNGLCRIDRETGNHEPVTRGAGGAYDQGIQNSITEMADALRYMDGVLKSSKAVLILHDLDAQRHEERDKDLNNALRDWALNSEILLKESVIILMCTNASMISDPVTAERMAVISAPLSLPGEREFMIIEMWNKLLNQTMTSNTINLLVQATAGLTIHQLKTILLESYFRSNAPKSFSLEAIKSLKSELIGRSDLIEIEESEAAGFESVGGYESVKRFVRDTLIKALSEPERARMLDSEIPRGIILFGPPGTGKTLFAKALAREVNLPFINFKVENLYSQFLGVSGHRFRDAINLIEQISPAIVFIDEIDMFGKRRGDVNDGASEETRRVFNQVLRWLGDPRKSVVVGTTNRPEDLDRAFRVARIDYWIPFLYPNRTARTQILRIHLRSAAIGSSTIATLAERTECYSGAELEELVRRAKRFAFAGSSNRLSEQDLLRAYETFRIDQEARRKELAKYLQLAEEYTNDLEFLRELRAER